jgi:AcrR family transcriptional regulator
MEELVYDDLMGEMARRDAYHHGNLREALIDAAILLLKERGIAGFTLRECARRVGVSASAAAHHFGDVTGLFTAIAVVGYQRLGARMTDALAENDPLVRLRRVDEAYLRFAREETDLFRVTFGSQANALDPELHQSAKAALDCMLQTLSSALGVDPTLEPGLVMSSVMLCWAAMHGLATLSNEGRLGKVALGMGLPDVNALEGIVIERLVSLIAAAAQARP